MDGQQLPMASIIAEHLLRAILDLPGLEQPLYYWLPSIAPSGMAFSTSDIYPRWKGNLLVGSLKFEYLERLLLKDNKVKERKKYWKELVEYET